MSQDLFAAFGNETSATFNPPTEGSKQDSSAKTGNFGFHNAFQQSWSGTELSASTTQPISGIIQTEDDEDDFGDFEDASAQAMPSPQTQSKAGAPLNETRSSPMKTGGTPFPPKAPSKQAAPSKPDEKQQNIGQHPFAGHMDLLFEAGDDEYNAGTDELGDLSTNPEAAMEYSKRIIAEQEAKQRTKPASNAFGSKALAKAEKRSDSGPRKLQKKSGYVPAKDPNVLFDADNISDDNEGDFDDFGQFEGVESVAPREIRAPKPNQDQFPARDLLGLDETATIPNPQRDKQTKDSMHSAAYKAQPSKAQPETRVDPANPKQDDDDDWDDFEDSTPYSEPISSITSKATSVSQNASPKPTTASNKNTTLPPTNVPPPLILLSVFPSLFAGADEALFDTLGKMNLKQKQMLLAHPASHQFLKGYLGHCKVLAHIIAGRKLRWKRDQQLSQSMRIGPAAAGGKGGMKLTGLDKTEAAKEDREVLDTLRLWKNQVGKLRTAVTAASAAPAMAKLPAVPDIAEQMPIKALKPAEGGITAPHACALCGLKREERVAKVDVEIEDSFGEWWVQGMNMHVLCRNFWDESEKKLKSR